MAKDRARRPRDYDAGRHRLSPDLAAQLRLARERLRATLADVATAAGISAPYLCQLEHGQRAPSTVTAAALCEVLRLPWSVTNRLQGEAVDGHGRAYHSNPDRSTR